MDSVNGNKDVAGPSRPSELTYGYAMKAISPVPQNSAQSLALEDTLSKNVSESGQDNLLLGTDAGTFSATNNLLQGENNNKTPADTEAIARKDSRHLQHPLHQRPLRKDEQKSPINNSRHQSLAPNTTKTSDKRNDHLPNVRKHDDNTAGLSKRNGHVSDKKNAEAEKMHVINKITVDATTQLAKEEVYEIVNGECG